MGKVKNEQIKAQEKDYAHEMQNEIIKAKNFEKSFMYNGLFDIDELDKYDHITIQIVTGDIYKIDINEIEYIDGSAIRYKTTIQTMSNHNKTILTSIPYDKIAVFTLVKKC